MKKKDNVNILGIIAIVIAVGALFFSCFRVIGIDGYSTKVYTLSDSEFLSPYLDFPERTVEVVCTNNTKIIHYTVEYWTEIWKTDKLEAMCVVIYEEPNKYVRLELRN